MNTSYFSKIDNLCQMGYTNFVAVSGYVPEFYNELLLTNMNNKIRFRRCIELAPKKEWFFKWKNGEFDNNKYIQLYYETVLNKLNAEELYELLGHDAILLCYEKPNEFCHRHLIADWFNKELNLKINEINFDFNEFIF